MIYVLSSSVSLLPPVIGEYAYYLPTVFAWTATLFMVAIPYYHYIGILCREERAGLPKGASVS